MRIVRPRFEGFRLRVVECENDKAQAAMNGTLFGIFVTAPLIAGVVLL